MNVKEKVFEIVASVCETEVSNVNENSTIGDFPQWDSMGHLTILSNVEDIPAPTPIPARSPCRPKWLSISAGRRSFWDRRRCRAATARPSAMATRWRSPLPARRRRRTPSATFSATSCARESPCAWRATDE